jgi:hypothetical protein
MWGRSNYCARPVAYRDVEYFGGRRKKGDKTTPVGMRVVRVVYVDELRDTGELADYVALVQQVLGRCAEALGLVLEAESKRKADVEYRVQQLLRAERAMAHAVDRPDAAKPHRKPKRAKVRAGARRTSSLGGTPVCAKAGPRREDGLGERRARRHEHRAFEALSAALHRGAAQVRARKGDRSEDGL